MSDNAWACLTLIVFALALFGLVAWIAWLDR